MGEGKAERTASTSEKVKTEWKTERRAKRSIAATHMRGVAIPREAERQKRKHRNHQGRRECGGER